MIKYHLKNSYRAKRLRITINRSGEVTVIRPWFVSQFFVNSFIREKSQWIKDNIFRIKRQHNDNLLIPRRHRQAYLKYRENTRQLIKEIITKYNSSGQFVYNQIRIKNPRTIWGSCSQDRNLNFSYRLVYMPRYMAEYIVVHELCHLHELNHSKKFWSLVGELIPNYKEIEKKLKKV